MKFLHKPLICAFLSFGLLTSAVANTDEAAVFKRYEQAKLKLAYEGEVGDLLQLVSNRLNIGYLSYKIDPNKKVKFNNSTPITVKNLIEDLQKQVPDIVIQFEKVDSTVFMSAVNKQTPLKLKQDQFISEAIFEEEANTEIPVVQPQEGNQIEVILDNEMKENSAQEVNEEKKP